MPSTQKNLSTLSSINTVPLYNHRYSANRNKFIKTESNQFRDKFYSNHESNSNYSDLRQFDNQITRDYNYTAFTEANTNPNIFSEPAGETHSMKRFEYTARGVFKPDFIMLNAWLRLKGYIHRSVLKDIASNNKCHVYLDSCSESDICLTDNSVKLLEQEMQNENKLRNIEKELTALYGPAPNKEFFNFDNFIEKDWTADSFREEGFYFESKAENANDEIRATDLVKPSRETLKDISSNISSGESSDKVTFSSAAVENTQPIADSSRNDCETNLLLSENNKCEGPGPGPEECLDVVQSTPLRPSNNPGITEHQTREILALIASYQNEYEDLSRFTGVLQLSNGFCSPVSITPDSACNCNLISLENFIKCGGNRNIIEAQEGMTLRNSTESNVCSPLLGHALISVYVKDAESELVCLERTKFLVIESGLSEILLGCVSLRRLKFNWSCEKNEHLIMDCMTRQGETARVKIPLNKPWTTTLTNVESFTYHPGPRTVKFSYLNIGQPLKYNENNYQFSASGQIDQTKAKLLGKHFLRREELENFCKIKVVFHRTGTARQGEIAISARAEPLPMRGNSSYLNKANPSDILQSDYIENDLMEKVSDMISIKAPKLQGVSREKMPLDHLPSDRRAAIEQLNDKYPGVFSSTKYDVGLFTTREFGLDHDGQVYHDAYRPPKTEAQKKALEREIEQK